MNFNFSSAALTRTVNFRNPVVIVANATDRLGKVLLCCKSLHLQPIHTTIMVLIRFQNPSAETKSTLKMKVCKIKYCKLQPWHYGNNLRKGFGSVSHSFHHAIYGVHSLTFCILGWWNGGKTAASVFVSDFTHTETNQHLASNKALVWPISIVFVLRTKS